MLEALPLDDTTTGAAISRIDRLSNGGAIVDSVSDVIYEAAWSPDPGEYTYLRIRYTLDDGTEDRVWISPWFAR